MTTEYTKRIERLQQYLTSNQIDLVLLNTNSDIYYYTGSMQPLYVIVPCTGDPLLLARKAVEQIKKDVPDSNLKPFYGGKDLAAILEKYGFNSVKRAAFTLDTTSYATVTRMLKMFGNPEIVDMSWDIRPLRTVKSESEIEIQRRAGYVLAEVPRLVRDNFKPGMTELEISVAIEDYFRLHGHAGVIRCRREGIDMSGIGVCSSGVNMLAGGKFDGICSGTGTTPAAPHGAGYTPIERGVPVILDFAFNLEGYIVDQTRMFSWGKPSDQVLKAYDDMSKIEEAILNSLHPGVTWEEPYELAVKMADDMGYSEEFMGLGYDKVRFVGHGVGLELDEPPFIAPGMKYALEEGMVIAIEPKVSLPGVGVIGPEDTVVVRSDEVENLTTCSRDFIIV